MPPARDRDHRLGAVSGYGRGRGDALARPGLREDARSDRSRASITTRYRTHLASEVPEAPR